MISLIETAGPFILSHVLSSHNYVLQPISRWASLTHRIWSSKDHPALGPGAVDDSAVTPPNVATEVVVPDEQEDDDDSYTPEATRCQ